MPQPDVMCPHCGRLATATITQYGVRHSHCGLWSWGGKPLADQWTHQARQDAHAAFDKIWKQGRMTRSQAYEALRKALGLTKAQAHMSVMDAGTARLAAAWASSFVESSHAA